MTVITPLIRKVGNNFSFFDIISHNYIHKGDKNLLHSIMSQIDSVYSRPFPSPDHTYAISPVKEEVQEPATSNGVKTETPETPDEEQTPTYRGRVSASGHVT